jgi:NADH dehydrogenase
MKKVIIAGGGFAGMNLAKRLSEREPFDVLVVDRNNYHFFPPLLYQVSTAFIEASNISYPFRKMFQERKNVRFFMGSVLGVQPAGNTLETDHGTLAYDYLVLAMGTETNFFGNQNVMRHALPMKTIDDALHIRNHILLHIEEAIRSPDLADKERLSNIVIAGGGPTGVELAGMMAEMGRNIVAKDYPEARPGTGNIFLVNGGPALLGPMSKNAQDEALGTLKKLGVKIIPNTRVTDYANETVSLSDGSTIRSATLIWASGVIGCPVNGFPAETFAPGRRLFVDDINRVRGYDNIFAIGDQCYQTSDAPYPNGHPQLAQVAIQQGTHLAKNLLNIVQGRHAKPFRYNDKGTMAIISKYKAVVDLPRGFFRGFFAWLVWLFIHIIPLVGFRNKLKVASNWFSSFITNDPTLRLIIRPEDCKPQNSPQSTVDGPRKMQEGPQSTVDSPRKMQEGPQSTVDSPRKTQG